MQTRNPRLGLAWAVVVLALGLGIYLAGRLWSTGAARAADLTPGTPAVTRLRAVTADANVVLVVLDATRADHVGCYGYPRQTTPTIDRLAADSLLFEWHFSQSTETKSSTATLLTSQYCDTHLSDGPRSLLPGTFTWEQGLAEAGFETALFSSNLKASPVFGIGEDFQHVACDRDLLPFTREGEERARPEVLLRAFEEWLSERGEGRFFAYLHFMPPHYPYFQPEEMTELFRGLEPVAFEPGSLAFPEPLPRPLPTPPALPGWVNLYDANLRYGDWAVGELVELLEDRELWERTLLIVTSDHGEGFGEHGYVWHGKGVYDEECHIPLIIRFPGARAGGRRIEAFSATVDMLPTVFDLLGVRYPAEGVQGHSLLPVMAGEEERARDQVFCRAGGSVPKYLTRNRQHALILFSNGTWRALYDLGQDPEQQVNLIDEQPETAERMLHVFGRFAETQRRPPRDCLDPEAEMPPLPEAPVRGLTPEQEQQLRNLGYVR